MELDISLLHAIRALGRLNTARAAELALGVLEKPMDPFLDYALWLTINELATPWLDAVRSGTWLIAGREAQLAFGLKAVEPALAADVLARLLANRPLPRDGSGPWLELIATAGGDEFEPSSACSSRHSSPARSTTPPLLVPSPPSPTPPASAT